MDFKNHIGAGKCFTGILNRIFTVDLQKGETMSDFVGGGLISDLIDRQTAIETAMTMYERCTTGDIIDLRDLICESLAVLPSVELDISEYSDRLWKLAYERGKTEGIVRCKDCSYYVDGFPYAYCDRNAVQMMRGENDYCSRGERRTDD